MMRDVHQLAVGTDSLGLTDVRRRLKAIFIGSIGNLVEWYDFYAYTAFALYFAESFFPGNDPVVQQLNAALLFAAGFVMRPIGGWLFGHLADHHGRRNALMLSVLLMCFGSPVIAMSLIVSITMRDTKRHSALDLHE
jgi:MHS family alpha-ketoglutarate permease-like MFS transporter